MAAVFTDEMKKALLDFAEARGKKWKMELSTCWMTGAYPSGVDSASLQRYRNSFGPSALTKLKLSDLSITPPKTMWVLVASVNEYDQHGDYLVAAFTEKPTLERLSPLLKNSIAAQQLIATGKFLDTPASGGRSCFELTEVVDGSVYNQELCNDVKDLCYE